jgi:8-oxo-dGTP diphosphatase
MARMATDAEQLSFPQTWPQPQSNRITVVVDVNVLLVRGGLVLLGRRHNTGYEDGSLHLPAGHLEGGESLITALLREAWEELGILIDPSHPRLVHVVHHSAGGGRLSFFFEVTDWKGEVTNREPHKCKSLGWYPLAALPNRIVPYTHGALLAYQSGKTMSCSGWGLGVLTGGNRRRRVAG